LHPRYPGGFYNLYFRRLARHQASEPVHACPTAKIGVGHVLLSELRIPGAQFGEPGIEELIFGHGNFSPSNGGCPGSSHPEREGYHN
jgi:hypothetical protein